MLVYTLAVAVKGKSEPECRIHSVPGATIVGAPAKFILWGGRENRRLSLIRRSFSGAAI